MIAVAYKNNFSFKMSDYEEKDEEGENMFGMSIKDDDDDEDPLDIDPLVLVDDVLPEEGDEVPLVEDEEGGLFLEDGDEEVY